MNILIPLLGICGILILGAGILIGVVELLGAFPVIAVPLILVIFGACLICLANAMDDAL